MAIDKFWDPGYGDVARTKNLEYLRDKLLGVNTFNQIIVGSSENANYKTLDEALDAASLVGNKNLIGVSTILLEDGEYTLNTGRVFYGNDIMVQSLSGDETAVTIKVKQVKLGGYNYGYINTAIIVKSGFFTFKEVTIDLLDDNQEIDESMRAAKLFATETMFPESIGFVGLTSCVVNGYSAMSINNSFGMFYFTEFNPAPDVNVESFSRGIVAISMGNTTLTFSGCTVNGSKILANDVAGGVYPPLTVYFNGMTLNNGAQYGIPTGEIVSGLTSQLDGKPMTLGGHQGTTAERPTGVNVGFDYFDTDLSKPLWYNGKGWVDSTGAAV